MSRNWLPRNQGPPSRRYEGAANAANGSAIDSDIQGDHNPSTSRRYAGPSASCSASTLTTRGKPFASATSPPAKSSCVRRPYGTPQPKRQFSVTRRLKGGGGGDTGIIRRDPRQPPTTRPHWRAGKPSRRRRNRNRMDRRERVGRKVHLSWKEWSMRWVGFLGQRGRARTAKSFPPKPDCYSRKRSALNSPQRGSSNIRPTHAGSGAYCAGKLSSSSWYTSASCWWRVKRSSAKSAW